MKDSVFTSSKKSKLPNRSVENRFSVIIEEVLNITYPQYAQLFSFKKEELHRYIFNYLFRNKEDLFYTIGAFTNMMTASCLKGFLLIIQKNNLNSFEALDLHMATKKARSFALLGSTLAEHEVLNDHEKDNIVGGKKSGQQPSIPYNLYFYTDKGRTA